MAKMDVKTEVQGPDEITINLVREDFLITSNTYRIFFEICLAIAGAFLGSNISLLSEEKSVPVLNWLIFVVMAALCVAFLGLTVSNYKKAKCKTNNE
jgi:hypothetical protein